MVTALIGSAAFLFWRGSGRQAIAVPRESRARRIGERLLILVGPRTYYSCFGSGQCGACPRYGATVYELLPTGQAEELFQHSGTVDLSSVGDADIPV